MTTNAINIVLVDDEALFRKGMAFILGREKNFNILFEAADGEMLQNALAETNVVPDIILMDLKMPKMNGVEATKFLHKEYPEIKVIALTSYTNKAFIINMVDVGASSYLVKNASPDEVVHTINEVATKGFYYNDEVMRVIHQNMLASDGKPQKSRLDSDLLTKREKEVLQLICEQKTTAEIGEQLFISPRTVEGHRNNLLLKTESKNTAGLVIFGIQNKLVDLQPNF
ncbi:response regulator [Sungkyunkwania multivorans]|uniref:Response regulator n=1 Tax=Sungkyunkwania multivorans TaxID=1173618 RepID=A0ABW3CXV5_9FLAO